MKKLFYSAFLFGAVLTMAACSGKSAKTTSETDNSAKTEVTAAEAKTINLDSLQGEWNIMTVNGVKIVQDAETPFLGFNISEKRLYGMTGCNRVMGMIETTADQPYAIRFGQLGSTKMMCHNDSLEQAVLKAIGEISAFGAVKCEDAQRTCVGLFDTNQKEVILLQKKLNAETESQEIPM